MKRAPLNKQKFALWKKIASGCKWRNLPEDEFGYINPNKKKVRGWKRRLRDLQHWGSLIQEPWLGRWHEGGSYEDACYKMQPWYTFYGIRRPPLWFARILIQQFVMAYDNWDKKLEEFNEPYDLQLQIHDDRYILSEIECKRTGAFGEQVYYWPPSAETKPFPYHKFSSKDYDISSFKWQLCDEEDFVFENAVYWRGTTVEILLAKGYTQRENAQGLTYFAKKIGDVWAGRKGKSIESKNPIITRRYPIAPPG